MGKLDSGFLSSSDSFGNKKYSSEISASFGFEKTFFEKKVFFISLKSVVLHFIKLLKTEFQLLVVGDSFGGLRVYKSLLS